MHDDILLPSNMDTTLQCDEMSNISANDIMLPIGSGLSLISYAYLFWMYFVVKSPILIRHPTELAVFKCMFDILYIQQYLWLPFLPSSRLYQDLASEPPYPCNASTFAGIFSFISQFSLLGSELCFLIISFDLRNAYTNPFSSFKENRVKYAVFVIGVSLFMSVVLIACGPQIYGLASEGIVWVQTKRLSYDSNYFTEPNYPKFFLLYLWNVMIYVYCIWASFQYSRTYAKGLSKTLSNRLNIMQRSRRFTLAFIVYDTITLGSEFLSFLNYYDSSLVNSFPPYFYSVRGFISVLIIIYANHEDLTWDDLDPFSVVFHPRHIQQREHDLIALEGLLLQPHLNAALRVELLYFATQGIMHAARDFGATEARELEQQREKQRSQQLETASTSTEVGSPSQWHSRGIDEDEIGELRRYSFDSGAGGKDGGFRASFVHDSSNTVDSNNSSKKRASGRPNQVHQSIASEMESTVGLALRPVHTVQAGNRDVNDQEIRPMSLDDLARMQRAQAAAVTLEVEAALRDFTLDHGIMNPYYRPSLQGMQHLASDPEVLESILRGQSARESLRSHHQSVRASHAPSLPNLQSTGDDEDDEEDDEDDEDGDGSRDTLPAPANNSMAPTVNNNVRMFPGARGSSLWSRFSFVPSSLSISQSPSLAQSPNPPPSLSMAPAPSTSAGSKSSILRSRWFSFARPQSDVGTQNNSSVGDLDVEFSMRRPSSSSSYSRSASTSQASPAVGTSPGSTGVTYPHSNLRSARAQQASYTAEAPGLEDGLWHRVPRRTTSTASGSVDEASTGPGGVVNPLLSGAYGKPAPRFSSRPDEMDDADQPQVPSSVTVRDRLLHSLYTATHSLFLANNPMHQQSSMGAGSTSQNTGVTAELSQSHGQSPSTSVPPQSSSGGSARFTKDFRFQDYAPRLFAAVRRLHNIDTVSYVDSFVSTCRERFTEGRSGAFMFYSADERCIVKTTSKEDIMALRQLLPAYVDYLHKEPQSLLCRFLGAHCLTMYGVDLYFVVMLNLFPPQLAHNARKLPQQVKIAERYDLKGSWVNRHGNVRSRSPGELLVSDRVHGAPLLMDNDLLQRLSLQPRVARRMAAQVHKDVSWLVAQGRMDFSLLIGVKRERFKVQPQTPAQLQALAAQQAKATQPDSGESSADQSLPSGLIMAPGAPVSVDAQAQQRSDPFELSADGSFSAYVVEGAGGYYLGLIDVLQGWTWKKRLEHFFKVYALRSDPRGVSAVPPGDYAVRFYRRCVLDVFDHLDELPPALQSLSLPRNSHRPTGAGSLSFYSQAAANSQQSSAALLPQVRRITEVAAGPPPTSESGDLESGLSPDNKSSALRKRKKKKKSKAPAACGAVDISSVPRPLPPEDTEQLREVSIIHPMVDV